jgi:hypothetical protein
MGKRLVAAVVLLLSIVLIGTGASSQSASVARGVTVLFPGEPGFSDREQEFTSKTGLKPGTTLATEFDKGVPIGEVRSSTGLVGTIFQDALNLPALALGQMTHIIYGTIAIPEGAAIRGKSFSGGSYGVVVYGAPLVIVLAERQSGNLAAFVVTSSTLFLPATAVMEVLFQLITFSAPAIISPSSFFGFQLSINCEKLPAQQEIDVPVGSGKTLVELAAAFAVKEAGLGSLAVTSFGPPLVALVTAPNYLYLNLVGEKKEAEVTAPVGPEFTLLVQAGEETAACIEAAYTKSTSGEYHLVGKAYHN